MEKEFTPIGLPLFTLTTYNYFYAYIRGIHLSPPTKILSTLQFHKQMFRCRFLNYEIIFEVSFYHTVLFQITSEKTVPEANSSEGDIRECEILLS